MKGQKILKGILFYLMLFGIVAITILPFLWMISSSFKGSEAIRTIPIRWIPERPTLEGYVRVFNMQGFSFPRATLNSLVLAIASTVVAVGSATMAAFVFAKLPFRGSGKIFGLYLATMMIPGTKASQGLGTTTPVISHYGDGHIKSLSISVQSLKPNWNWAWRD